MDRKYGLDFSKDMELNRNQLHIESEMNPSMIECYQAHLAEARKVRDGCERKYKYALAEAELKYRRTPPPDIKVTDNTISALVTCDPLVVTLSEEYTQSKAVVYKYEAAVSSLQAKGAEIKNLTALWIGGYFSTTVSAKNNTRKIGEESLLDNE